MRCHSRAYNNVTYRNRRTPKSTRLLGSIETNSESTTFQRFVVVCLETTSVRCVFFFLSDKNNENERKTTIIIPIKNGRNRRCIGYVRNMTNYFGPEPIVCEVQQQINTRDLYKLKILQSRLWNVCSLIPTTNAVF